MPRSVLALALPLVTALLVSVSPLRAQIAATAGPDIAAPPAPFQLAQAQAQAQTPRRASPAKPTYTEMKDKYNKWTVGLAAGLYEGAGTRMASELAKALQDDENMRVLPLLTSGLFG